MTLSTKETLQLLLVFCIILLEHDREDEGFNWDEHGLDKPRRNSSGEGSSRQANVENIQDKEMKFVRDKIAQSICWLQMIFATL